MNNIGDFNYLKNSLNSSVEWEERISLLNSLSSEYIASIETGIIQYYASLETSERFFGVWGTDIEIKTSKCSTWEDWNYSCRIADRTHPSEIVFYIKKLLDKASNGAVLRWLEQMTYDWEIISVINFCSLETDKNELLKEACTSDNNHRTKSILFFYAATDSTTNFDELYKIVSEHKENFRVPILDMLCDFYLRPDYTAEFAERLFELYADSTSLDYISPKSQSKGTLFAWSRLLCERNTPKESELAEFSRAYFSWLKTEPKYSFSEQTHMKKEFDFVNQLCTVICVNDATCNDLLALWKQKSEYYYGWKSHTTDNYSKWFFHIGLLLWCMGLNRYNNDKNQSLFLTISEFLNKYILSALSSASYRLLVIQIFKYDYDPLPELESCMCELIAKIYETETLLAIADAYMKTKFQRASVFELLSQKIKVVYKFENPSSISKEKISSVTKAIEKAIATLDSN